ncbi:hypothetical protein Vadar_004930 [Vaccinium darrowii]|uniref:Uncharacterized protein n=1 Tax=Vaccinium darrowii TaxID=229202 RepID=A0ACB7Z9D1_9ERIC|nr:hypothetical protein Vadar_004930 [Vaccinium darrowii]
MKLSKQVGIGSLQIINSHLIDAMTKPIEGNVIKISIIEQLGEDFSLKWSVPSIGNQTNPISTGGASSVVQRSIGVFLANTKFVLEARTMERMELLVLSTFKWRMLSLCKDCTDGIIVLGDSRLAGLKFNISDQKLQCLLRCGKSCCLRWTNYLRPDIKRGPFSPEEEKLVIQLHGILGKRYTSTLHVYITGSSINNILIASKSSSVLPLRACG